MRRETIHRLFWISIFLKGLDGALEVIGGVTLFFIGNDTFLRLIQLLTAPELAEDPHDLIATALRGWLGHLSTNTKLFASAYLFGHGAVKLFFVAGLWREKLWAFPTALAIITAFVIYQIYRLCQTPSLSLIALTIIDIFIIAMIWREYRFKQNA
ncbi:MAG: DUF2127 domain-containing protein [Verrucomicrobiota bacterium]|nr:DUF2127 domain-containing protein [Verrucomicrobiota bacterium]